MKNMKVWKFTENLNEFRQYGDAPRITKIVNELRTKRGDKPLAPSYIRAMLNGSRTLTPEVAEVVEKYYQMQESLNNINM
jgi:hypothetical protein